MVRPSISVLLGLLALAPVAAGGSLHAQTSSPAEVRGVVRAADTGLPLAGAAVTLVGTGRTVITHADGHFHLRAPGGAQGTLRVERLGYRSVDLLLPADEPLVLRLVPAAVDIAGLVVTGTLTERGADETIHPVGVLASEELQRRLGETLGATLASQPGVTSASMGPATARPVIRGMGGDRVLVLEDGIRLGDVSSSGADHATATDPASARRVEVVRGPAALLYGSNALGGVVNVIRDEIPAEVVHHLHGTATLQGRSVNGGMVGSMAAHLPLGERIPLRLELTGRTAGDLATPQGTLENTSLDAWTGGVGAALVDGWGAAGAAFRFQKSDYGIPGGFTGGHAEGVRVAMERAATKARLTLDTPPGPFSTVQADAAYTWYRHKEIEPPDILGTFFKRQVASAEVVARRGTPASASAGALGMRVSWERHDFAGSLATPDTRLYTAGVFAVEERDLGPLLLEAGLRWDWARTDPLQRDPEADIGDIRPRTFHAASGSLGALLRLTDGVAVGASLARAFRVPDVGELYSEGPHLAAYIFEVGNPDLGTEVGTGVDAFVRVSGEGFRSELTAFHNRLSGYIYPRATGDTSRVRLPIYQFSGEDARLTGMEAALEWSVLEGLTLDGSASWVRGTLDDGGHPLPLIPPLQGVVAAEISRPAWFVRGETAFAAAQGRVGAFETPTSGYAVHHVSAGVRRTVGGRLNALTVTLENATDRVYRNHLSRVKEIMPEAGRGLRVTYRVVF